MTTAKAITSEAFWKDKCFTLTCHLKNPLKTSFACMKTASSDDDVPFRDHFDDDGKVFVQPGKGRMYGK